MILVGNQVDTTRAIETKEGEELAKKLRIPFIETSAKKNYNISEMLHLLVRVIRGHLKFQVDETILTKLANGGVIASPLKKSESGIADGSSNEDCAVM